MKIKTQFAVTMILFGAMLAVIFASIIVTVHKSGRLEIQKELTHRIQQDAATLGYLSNDYLLYREGQQRTRWNTQFDSFSSNVSKLNPEDPEGQALLDHIKQNLHRWQAVFLDAAGSVPEISLSQDIAAAYAVIQVAWSRMAVQNQGISFQAARLEELFERQIDRLKYRNVVLIVILLVIFGAYFFVLYLIVFRRTMRSISRLQSGAEMIGSGDLDYVIPAEYNDEIGELSRAFNRMTANLKRITASKSQLEMEITERQRVEEELRRQREWLQVTLTSIGDAVIAADTAGRIAFINPIAVTLTGWASEEAMGRPIQSVVRTINEITGEPGQDIVRCVLTEGCIVHMTNHTALVTRSGEQVPIEDSAAPIKDSAGNLIGAVLVFRDVTEKRRAQSSLREAADRLRIVADFPYNWEYWRGRDNRFLYVSPSCERITGYTPAGFIEDPGLLFRIIHPDDRERISKHMFEDLVHNSVCELEFRILHRDGGVRWIGHVCQPVVNAQGQFMGRRVSNRDITERKRSEQALQEAHQRSVWLAQFPEQNPNPVVRVSADGTVLYSNPASARFQGWAYYDGQILQNEMLLLVGQAIAERREVRQDLELGERSWMVSVAPSPVERYATVYGLDITDRNRAEESLRRSELLYRDLVQNANSAIIRWKSDGAIVFFNEYSQKLFGYDAEEVIGRNVDILVPETESSGADLKNLLKDIVDHPERYLHNINENICRDGRRVWMNWTNKPIRDENGNVEEILAIGSDFTQIKTAQEALTKSELRFRLLSETAGHLLAVDDPQKIIEDLCRQVMAYLDCQACFNFVVDSEAGRLHLNVCIGIPEEEIRKIEWLDYGVAVCGCVAQKGERIVAENIGSADDPRTDLVASYGIRAYACHPLIVHDRLIGTLSFGTRTRDCFLPEDLDLMKTVADQVATAMDHKRILLDLQRSRDELEARVQERTVELDKRARQLSFLASELTLVEERERRRLAGILHDNLQQLLVAAKMNIEILTGSVAAAQRPTIEHILDLMTQSIKVSRSLTDELSPPLLQHYGLSASLKWLGRWMQEMHGFSVDLSVDSSLDPKGEDFTVLLFQSVRELLFNVVKHAGVKSARVEMRQDKKGRRRIVVSDQGVGFDSKIVREDANVNPGLGLFSIRERMMLMGGSLEVESEPGMGASFSLVLPPEKIEAAEAEPPEIGEIATKTDMKESASQNIGDRIRVMLVDDHEVVRNGLSTLLGDNPDMEIVGESSDGEEAVQLAREVLPDVIIMDINMPKMNGLEVTRRIHSEFPHIRIIILTMYEGHEEASAALSAGASAFLTKSGSSDRLLAVIRSETEDPAV